VTCRISSLRFRRFVDPNPEYLTGCAGGDVHSDSESGTGGRASVAGEPAEERWDGGKGTASGDDERAIPSLCNESVRDAENM